MASHGQKYPQYLIDQIYKLSAEGKKMAEIALIIPEIPKSSIYYYMHRDEYLKNAREWWGKNKSKKKDTKVTMILNNPDKRQFEVAVSGVKVVLEMPNTISVGSIKLTDEAINISIL